MSVSDGEDTGESTDPAKVKTPRVRTRRVRSVSESLLSIVLVLESLLVFFATLTNFTLDPARDLSTLVGGGVLFGVTLGVSRSLRSRWARWLAWIIQLALIASGILVPLMFIIGTGFVALFTYCFVIGRRLDQRNARFAAAEDEASEQNTEPDASRPNPKETP